MFTFDHIAIGCETLAEGVAWTEMMLGISLAGGGRHVHFGTHNMLLGMGDLYLEVIAKDPSAPPTGRATWFDLDNFTGPPRLANWICHTTDFTVAPEITGPPVRLSRGDLQWQLTVPNDGSLPMQGGYPSLLQWDAGISSPSQRLPDSGCRLANWQVSHPKADWLRDNVLLNDLRVTFASGPFGFQATFDTPHGQRQL